MGFSGDYLRDDDGNIGCQRYVCAADVDSNFQGESHDFVSYDVRANGEAFVSHLRDHTVLVLACPTLPPVAQSVAQASGQLVRRMRMIEYG